MPTPNNALGYAIVDGEGEGAQFRGASLVVDLRGIPMDFRYTDPIRPSRLERILYGNALDVYLREELILQSLLGAVETKPQLWICSELDLLVPLRAAGKVKAVCLAQTSHAPLEAPGHTEPMGDGPDILLQADAVSAPLRATFPPSSRPEDVQATVALLVEAAKTMELLEPFGRIQKALLSLGEE
ncbi:MAG: hypothetical protein IJR14_11000 [Synergistaceae bacterium]|nr:hypothetical protein [Synergistaceae bacterium]